MSVGGSKGSSKQTTTNRLELPSWLDAAGRDLVNRTQGYLETPFQAYSGQMVAPLDPAQQQAYQQAVAGQGQYGGAINSAIDQTQSALNQVPQGYTAAQTTGAQVAAPDVSAARIDPLQIGSVRAQTGASMAGAYQNPYEQQVVNQTLTDIGRQGDIAGNAARARAAAAGSFGGSRSAILESETARGYADAAARAAGNLRQQGFVTANQFGQSDADRALQASNANLQANLDIAGMNRGTELAGAQLGLQAGLANQGSTNQANLANQGALNAAGQFNANLGLQGRGQTLAGAGQLAGLAGAGQEYNINDLNSLLTVGGLSQGNQQQMADAAYQEFMRQQNDLPNRLNTASGVIYGNPYNAQGTQTTKGGTSGKGGGFKLLGK